MKANYEIDDWIRFNGEYCRIRGYNDGKFRIGAEWLYGSQFEPIPLTPEILEKNIPFERYWDVTKNNPKGSVTEWRKDTDEATIFVRDFRDQKGEYILEIHIKDSANYGVKKSIYYIHELQHALRLCGLEWPC